MPSSRAMSSCSAKLTPMRHRFDPPSATTFARTRRPAAWAAGCGGGWLCHAGRRVCGRLRLDGSWRDCSTSAPGSGTVGRCSRCAIRLAARLAGEQEVEHAARAVEAMTPDKPGEGEQTAQLPGPQLWAAGEGDPVGFADLFLFRTALAPDVKAPDKQGPIEGGGIEPDTVEDDMADEGNGIEAESRKRVTVRTATARWASSVCAKRTADLYSYRSAPRPAACRSGRGPLPPARPDGNRHRGRRPTCLGRG